MDNTIGNITTIIKWISMAFSGWIIGTLTSQGLHTPINEEIMSQIICAVIFLLLGLADAKYPNTFAFLKEEPTIENTQILNDEYDLPIDVGGDDDIR